MFNYTSKTNPRIYFTVSKNGRNVGDLVFELYANHAPRTAEQIVTLATGKSSGGATYAGTKIDKGLPGFVL